MIKNGFQPDKNLTSWIIDIRRHIHRNPELGFQEEATADFICKKLDEIGVPYRAGIAKTGVHAWLGERERPCVALRADMDALPLQEKTDLPFSSQNDGIMHACGHDGHVAMVLGAAALLKRMDLPGRVALFFQPAEEGEGGAKEMIANGVLEGTDVILAGHIDRHFKVGEIAVEPGLICAYTDGFRIVIRGRGGHAAKPHETVDSIVVASLLVMSIQTLVSREVNPSYPSVVTVGQINGGSAANVIADQAVLEGTIRATHPKVRQKIITGLTRMVKAMEDLYSAETSIEFIQGYPPVINNPDVAEIVADVARQAVGSDGVARLPHPSLGGEDFSFYLEKVPGCFVRFGAQKDDSTDAPAHSPRFDFDEGVLPVGASFMARAAVTLLQRIDEIK